MQKNSNATIVDTRFIDISGYSMQIIRKKYGENTNRSREASCRVQIIPMQVHACVNLISPFIPSPIHAGGLRSHGMSPILSELYDQKQMRAVRTD